MPGAQEDSLVLKELGHALARLAPERRLVETMKWHTSSSTCPNLDDSGPCSAGCAKRIKR